MHALSEAEVLSDGQHLLAVEDITLARPMCAHSHGFAQVSLVRGGRADQHTEEGVNHLDTNTIVVLSPGSWLLRPGAHDRSDQPVPVPGSARRRPNTASAD